MDKRYSLGLSVALIILAAVAAGPAKTESPQGATCDAEVEVLNTEWRHNWSGWSSEKSGGGSFVLDNHGHRYSVDEYAAMHRRLDRSRKLCRQGEVEEARTEMWIVRSWLDADNDLPILK